MGSNKIEILRRLGKTCQIKPKDKKDQLSIIDKQEKEIKNAKKKALNNLIDIGFINPSNYFFR